MVLLGIGCAGESGECAVADKIYQAGDQFTAGDGCNTCTCQDGGITSCTEDPCVDCVHEGEEYALGESWPAGDGCNLCQCVDVGEVSCTTASCG